MAGSKRLSGWAPAPREAQECRPWQAGEPEWRQHIYPRTRRPRIAIWYQRAWYECEARMRYQHPDGRYSYMVDIDLTGEGSYNSRHFWYDEQVTIRLMD